MGVGELCNRCYHLTTARWSLVLEDAPVDEDLQDGKSFWIVHDDESANGDSNPQSTRDQLEQKEGSKAEAESRADAEEEAAAAVDDPVGSSKPDSYEPFSHHSLGDLLADQQRQCHLCRWIFDSLSQRAERYSPDESNHLFAIPFIIVDSIIDPLTKTLAFYYFWDDGRNPDSAFAVYIHMKPFQEDETPPFVDLSWVIRPATTAAIKQWAHECSTSHDRCRKLPGLLADELPVPGLPARLLELDKRNHRPFVRLCQSSSIDPTTPYATLSHCWGKGTRLQLMRANENDFMNRIPFAALPQIFADAVRVALDLGLSYLWIDALCILQDDEEDWIAESAAMAWIYSQAYVNIAATAANDMRDSLFDQTDELLANSLVLDTAWQGTGLESKRWLCFDEAKWQKYVVRAPLNQRAWVLQESLLAPRIIHFAKDQVWWTCRTVQRCESLPVSLSGPPPAGGLYDHLVRGNWEALIEAYTAAQLTLPRDRLIALSGIAWAVQVLHKYSTSQYIAGLWAQNLQMQLLWKTKGVSSVAQTYRAPSWSWASIDGTVEWDSSAMNSKKIWFAWGMRSWFDSGSDPFGPVVKASLRIDCMIYPVTVARLGTRYGNAQASSPRAETPTNGANGRRPGGPESATTAINGHGRSNSRLAVQAPYVVRYDSEKFGATGAAMGGLARVSPDDECFFDEGSNSMKTYFLPLCIVDASATREQGEYPTVSGLLIKPLSSSDQRGTYRRVGKLDMTYYRSPNVWTLYKEWMLGEPLKPLLYQKDHGGCRYDIVLE